MGQSCRDTGNIDACMYVFTRTHTCTHTYQNGVPTKELAGDLRDAEPKSATEGKGNELLVHVYIHVHVNVHVKNY